MIHDGRVKALPLVEYADTKANIEALATLTASDAGAFSYATDTAQFGVYTGTAWVWSLPGVWSDPHNLSDVNSIQFDLTPGVTPAEGQLCWDPVSKTLILGMPGGGVFLNIGQESIVRVKAAEDIDDGEAVYVSGVTGANLEVSLAIANDPLKCHPRSIYIATEAITAGAHGYVCRWGAINGIPLVTDADGAALANNDVLWLSATVPGGKVKTEPSSPNYHVKLGGVIFANASGIMSMSTYSGGKLNDNADVKTTSPAALDLMEYDASAQYWKNVPALKADAYRFGFVANYAGTQQTTIAFDGTNTFTLAPTGTTWVYYRNGTRCVITGSKTVDLSATPPAAKGLYYIYIDANDGTLSVATASWTLEDTKVPVATVAWDNALTPKYWLSDERHTVAIDRRFHWEHHYSDGTEIVTPTALSGLSVAPASPTDAKNTPGMSACVISDEDLKHSLAALTDPEGLSADYVFFYRTAASTWDWAASLTPFRYTASGYIQYDNAGTMTEGQNAKYYNTYLLLTNIIGAARYVWVHGQSEFSTLAAAQNEKFQALTRTGINVAEFVACYQLTWQTNSSYTTLGKCRLAATPVPISVAAAAGTSTGGGTTWGTITGTLQDQTDLAATIKLNTPATDGGIVKSGAGILTIAAGGAYTLTVSASCAVNQDVTIISSPSFAGVTVRGDMGLVIADESEDNYLTIRCAELTADRILTLNTGDASRTLTLSGNPTLGDWFDQSVKQAASPTFASVILPNAGYIGNSATTARLTFDSSGATDCAYFSGCNVGVGTVVPEYNLQVAGTAGQVIDIKYDAAAPALNQVLGVLQFSGADSGGGTICAAKISAYSEGSWSSSPGTTDHAANLRFYTSLNNDNIYERLRITGAGYVGIGTATPATLLHCYAASGNVIQTIETDSAGGAYLVLDGTQTTNAVIGTLQFSNAGDSIVQISAYRDGANDAGYLYFSTQATGAGISERMRITSVGNVLIGTTVAPTGTATKTLFFGDNGGNPTPGSNTAGVYAKAVSGTVEMFAIDSAGNAAQLTPHNYDGPVRPISGVLHWSQYHRNEYAGVEKWYDIERALLALEELTGEKFIHTRRIAKRRKPAKSPSWLRSFK